MSLDQLANIAEIVSSVAVIISLVYLALQIRSSTEAQRTSTYHSIVSDFAALNRSIASTPELSFLLVNAMENFYDLKPDEKARMSQLFFQLYHFFENMYYQNKKGYLEEEVWAGWKLLMLTYHSRPGFQAWWKNRRDVYSASFVRFLETEEIDKPIASYYDISQLRAEA